MMFKRNRLTSPKSHATVRYQSSCFKVERLEDRSLPSIAVGVYSPIDEVGNNVANPDWAAAPADQPGGAAIQLLRLSPQEYANGFSTPSLPYGGATAGVGGNVVTSFPMPSPRTISNDLFNQSPTLFGSPATDINTVDSNGLSDFGYSFGQFMDHDMDLTPDQTGLTAPPGDPAANKDGNDGFPIPADTTNPGDPIGSLAFSRSVYDPTTGTSAGNPRQQTNVITSYLDLSQVYGSSLAVSDALRTFSGGQLKTSPGNMLPYDNLTYFTQAQINALNMADSGPLPESSLYAAGDVRANENTELTSLTTLFVRNHNAIAAELQQENPTWTDQQLFEEARKLNIAEYQNIIYTQYLPALLGPDAPAYTGYNPNVNASIATEFSTVAYRFGHSMLNNTVERDANNGTSVGNVPLAVDFFDANLVNPSGAIDPYTGLAGTDIGAFLKGDADSSSQADDSMAVSSIRDDLFGDGIPGGEDLIARDIWRGRDDGIGTYNQVRVALGLPAITDDATFGFDQITSNVQVQQELELAYAKTIDAGGFAGDIDAFAGGMAEDHLPGSDMGPLFTAILTKQFSNLENGDQYFYRNELFTTQDLAILNQGTTLAQIITTNTGVTNLQANVFYYQPQTIVNNTLYVVGGSGTNDNVQINPIGTSNTGSTGVQVVATLRGVNTTTTYSQAFTSIVFFGGSGNDNINVASSLTIPVTINAGNGNDNVTAPGGSTVTLGNGNDNINLGAGNSTVIVGNGNDNLNDSNGTATVTLGSGNDNINLGAGSSTIVAGSGNDNINDSNGTATVTLGSGNDNINLGAGFSSITLGSGTGNDNINDSNGTATVSGGGANGNINVNLGAGSSTITLGNGNDNINDSNGTATVTLGSGNDNVNIGNGNNVITTGNGNDNINAGNGNNLVVTGNGNDNINAGNGDNLIVAGLGQHNVYLGNGSNILIDGSVTLTPGVTLSQVLTEWISFGAADSATIQSQMSITYNTKYANNLYAGTGLDWFFYTDTQDHTSYNADDLLN